MLIAARKRAGRLTGSFSILGGNRGVTALPAGLALLLLRAERREWPELRRLQPAEWPAKRFRPGQQVRMARGMASRRERFERSSNRPEAISRRSTRIVVRRRPRRQ